MSLEVARSALLARRANRSPATFSELRHYPDSSILCTRVVGDVDRDGVPDIVTSAPTKAIGGAAAGRVYVYSTKGGRLIWSIDGKPGDQLGSGVEAAGDTDHDGVPDVIASAPGAGKAYVYSGKDGRPLLTFSAEKSADNFGQHVSGVGDANGDGYADVIVGAPGNGAGARGLAAPTSTPARTDTSS